VLVAKLASVASVVVLIACFSYWGLRPAQRGHFCDDQEYLTMTTSFVRHLSPEFRPGDDTAMLSALPRSWSRSLKKKFPPGQPPVAYYPATTGEYYGFHFFAYPAAVAPVRAWLDHRPDAFRAHQYFNWMAWSAAMLSLLLLASKPRLFWPLLALTSLTPVLWFTTFASTETFVFSLGIIALACRLSGRGVLAILFSSLAAMQYQPLALLALFLCAEWLWASRHRLRRRWLEVVGVLASTALVFVPSAFYYLHFGAPNIIAREGLANVRFMSARKFAGLFIDLNGGLLVYAPGLLLMLVIAAGWSIARARRGNFWGLGLLGTVLLTMVASTVQRNWNHPTFGISRYALYTIAPALMFIGSELRWRKMGLGRLAGLCVVALALQAVVHHANGWIEYRGNAANRQSPIAAYVLERWPWLYNPHSEIFCERTTERCPPDVNTGETSAEVLPVAYLDANWKPRKLLAERCDEAKLMSLEAWNDEQRKRIHEAMRGCTGTGPMYIDF
jgi:hypothetical protein